MSNTRDFVNRLSEQEKSLEQKNKDSISSLVLGRSVPSVVSPVNSSDDALTIEDFFLMFDEGEQRDQVRALYSQLPEEMAKDIAFALQDSDLEALTRIANELKSLLADSNAIPENAINSVNKGAEKTAEGIMAAKEENAAHHPPSSLADLKNNAVYSPRKKDPQGGPGIGAAPSAEAAPPPQSLPEHVPITCADAQSSVTIVDKIFGDPVEAPHRGLGVTEQSILIAPGDAFVKGNEFLYAKWQKYLECFVQNKETEYFKFSITKPVEKRVLERMNSANLFWYVETKPHYNFYIENYEPFLNTFDNNLLPNMYVFSLQERELSHKRKPNRAFTDLITLVGEYSYNVMRPRGQYFDQFVTKYQSLSKKEEKIKKLSEQFSNILVPYEEVKFLNDVNHNKELYPMFVEISLPTDKIATFSKILEESSLTNVFMTEIVSRFLANDYESELPVQENLLEFDINNSQPNTAQNDVALKTIDIANWLDSFVNLGTVSGIDGTVDIFNNVNYDKAVFLGVAPREGVNYDASEFKLSKQLALLTFVTKLKNMILANRQSFMDIYRGKLAHSETVFYRISKYVGSSRVEAKLIQSYFIPNSFEIDTLNFVDTQVKYEEQYFYDITAYQVVFGTKLVYNWVADAGTQGVLRVISIPTIKVVEVPYFQQSVKISDTPPLQPQVEFIPYRDCNNKILINLNGDVGSRKEIPIPIENVDAEMIENIRKIQKLFPEEKKLTFSSDDHSVSFEVYRLENKPFSYEDFKGKLWKNVKADVDPRSKLKATSASLKDTIKPNQKYYYMFRTIDVHGKKSNPSYVYEAEIIDDDGFKYPSFKIVEFAEKLIPRDATKTVKKRIKLLPTLGQVIVNEEKSGLSNKNTAKGINSITLGVKEESLWGEQFKIRVISKHSGKKIDLNIKFTTEFDQTSTRKEE